MWPRPRFEATVTVHTTRFLQAVAFAQAVHKASSLGLAAACIMIVTRTTPGRCARLVAGVTVTVTTVT